MGSYTHRPTIDLRDTVGKVAAAVLLDGKLITGTVDDAGTSWLQIDGTVYDLEEFRNLNISNNRKQNTMTNHPVRARNISTATWNPDADGRSHTGTAAAVRRHLKAEQVLADTRAMLTEFDESWVVEDTADGDVVRCSRTIRITPPSVSVPLSDDPQTRLEMVEKTLVYVFVRVADRWYGTGRTAPNMATDEQLVDWCIDNGVKLSSFERATFATELADLAPADDDRGDIIDSELVDDVEPF